MAHKVKRSEWHFIQLLSFSNYIHYYPEIFAEINDLIVSKNKSMEKPLRDIYSSIANKTVTGPYTNKKIAFEVGQIYGRLNTFYIEAFNFTKTNFYNASGRARAFIKGLEDNSSLYYFTDFRVYENVLDDEFNLTEIETSLRKISALNFSDNHWLVNPSLMVK